MTTIRNLVICGPSGVGKGTIISQLMRLHPSRLGLSVSHTSRLPRPGEIDGVHYKFVTRSELANLIQQNKFLESATVHGNLYGTSYKAIDSVHSDGKVCVFDVDVKGVIVMKQQQLSAKYLFISPPNIEALRARLRVRGTETAEQITTRLHNAKDELLYGLHAGNFDAVVVNDLITNTMDEITELLYHWFPQQFDGTPKSIA